MATDALSKLRKAAGTASPARATSTRPMVTAPKSIAPVIAEWHEAERDLKTAESRKKVCEASMRDEAARLRVDVCRKQNKLFASIRLNGGKNGSVSFTQAARCLKMKDENEASSDPLRAEFGDDFGKLFNIVTTYKINEAALTPAIAERLIKALGKDVGILTAETLVVPADRFYSDSVLNTNVAAAVERVNGAHGLAQLIASSFKA